MGRFIKAKVVGAKEAVTNLQRANTAIRRAARNAIKKGANVVAKEVKRRTPASDRPEKAGVKPMRERIKVTTPNPKGKEIATANAKVRSGFAHILEHGTTNRGRDTKGGASTGRIQPKPFAAPSAEATMQQAGQKFAESLKPEIDRECAKLIKRKFGKAMKGKK